MTLIVKVRNLF